jgi:hypothetical protein
MYDMILLDYGIYVSQRKKFSKKVEVAANNTNGMSFIINSRNKLSYGDCEYSAIKKSKEKTNDDLIKSDDSSISTIRSDQKDI